MRPNRAQSRRTALGVLFAAAASMLAFGAAAQPAPGEVQRQLLQRQLYQDELLLRQRQFQQRLDPSLTPAQRLDLERRQFDQSQRQRQLHQSQSERHLQLEQRLPQLPEAQQQEQLLYEQQGFAREREALDPPAAFDP